MSANQALHIVLETAEKARDEALAEVDRRRRAVEAARQQAQALQDWRREYQSRWQAQFQQSGGMEIVRCYQDFMLRLGDAVGEQDRRVAQAEAHMARGQADLLACERKAAAVAKLIEKRVLDAQLKHNRQEQKATDEMAARAVRLSQLMGGGNPMASGSA